VDNSKVAEFTASYIDMHEEDLVRLLGRRSTLVEEAQVALDKVLVERAIDIAGIKEAERIDVHVLAEKAREAEARKEQRHASQTKIFLWVCIPITLLGILVNPDRSYYTFISSITQAVLLGLIALLFVYIRRAVAKRRKQ
jgi:hypothetical protein